MSNKKNKELQNESESEEEQDSGSGHDSDVDSEGNYVGDKVCIYHITSNSHGNKNNTNLADIFWKIRHFSLYTVHFCTNSVNLI